MLHLWECTWDTKDEMVWAITAPKDSYSVILFWLQNNAFQSIKNW